MTRNDISEQIIRRFKDDCFPSLILIDGDWGCGKTYFARNSLTPNLRKEFNHDVSHISLQGVSSIDDFRNRILSLHYSGKTNGHKLVVMAKNFIGESGKYFGDKGFTESMINTLSEPLKHHFLSNIDERIFILDDLERVHDEKLRVEILGECLSFAESKSNIYIVVIADTSKIKKHEPLEKAFGDYINMTISTSDVVEFVKIKNKSCLTPAVESEINNLVSRLKITNLRIIKRVLQLFSQIKYKIEKNDEIDQEPALVMMLQQIMCVCYAHYHYGYSLEEILSVPQASSERLKKLTQNIYTHKTQVQAEEKPVTEQQKRKDKLFDIFNSKPCVAMVKFCFHQAAISSDIVIEFQLPLCKTLIDKLISHNIHGLNEEDWANLDTEIESFLFNSDSKTYYKWFRVLDCYLYLINKHYVEADSNKILSKARVICDLPSNFDDRPKLAESSMLRNIEQSEVQKLESQVRSTIEKWHMKGDLTRLEQQFIKSWNSAQSEIYNKYDFKPFLHHFDTQKVLQGIKKWNSSEVIVFGQFISKRYASTNCYEFIGDEFLFVKNLTCLIKTDLKNAKPSMTTGLLGELYNYLEEAITTIKNREESQQGNP